MIPSLLHPRPRPLILFFLLLCTTVVVQAQCPNTSRPGVHVVQAGETLFGISKQYGMSLDQLLSLNRMQQSDVLSQCRELTVVERATVAGPAMAISPATAAPTVYGATLSPRSVDPVSSYYRTGQQQGQYHTVRPGETLASIALLYGYSTDRFRSFNQLAPGATVTPGTVLKNTDCNCDGQATPTPNRFTPRGVTPGAPSSYGNTPGFNGTGYGNSSSAIRPANPAAVPVNVSGAYLNTSEQAMMAEINLLRTNPSAYAAYVREFANNPRKMSRLRGSRNAVTAAANELLGELARMPRLSQLQPHPCLYSVAKAHGDELRRTNQFVHSDESKLTSACPGIQASLTRSRRAGFNVGNENLVVGYDNPRDAVIALLIDSDYPERLHRDTLLAPDWNYVIAHNFGTVRGIPNNYLQLFAR